MDAITRCDRSDVPPGFALLVGRLYLNQPTPDVRPKLELSVWCPHCRARHLHPWPDPPVDPREAMEVTARCRIAVAAYHRNTYWVALDQSHTEHNHKTRRFADAAFAQWERREARDDAATN